jgi:type IV pilus assembly protein PilW
VLVFAETALVEGIERLNVEYGLDTDGDGQPDATSTDPTTYTYAGCTTCTAPNNWSNVVTARIYLLARNIEPSPGYTDTKSYTLGGQAIAAANDAYRRHVYNGLIRIANTAGRRETP